MICGKAPCGMLYAVRRNSSSAGYCSLSIRCGTRNEGTYHSGIAHFTEHTIFKGTSHKRASTINGYLDRLGGESNAYTSKEEIVLHACVLKEDLPKACSLVLDLASSPTFPSKEIEKEKGVVIDEIHYYEDTPADDIYDRFEERFFWGHPLSGMILGTESSVNEISSDELRRFVGEKFRPELMAFTLVADFDEKKMERDALRLIGEYFGTAAPVGLASVTGQLLAGTPPEGDGYFVPTFRRFDETVDMDGHEANVVIGYPAPALYDGEDRLAAILLANILGGPASNSILNATLRERHGWVYSVESSYTQYADAGVFAVILGCDKSNVEKCCLAVRKELLRQAALPLSPTRLKAAKKQLLGQLAISSDKGENLCLSMGKSLLDFGWIDSDERVREKIESVTAGKIREVAARIFVPEKRCRLVFS